MKEIIEDFYAYLRDKYGTRDIAIPDSVEIVTRAMRVNIPGVRKNNEKHKWVVHVEIRNNEKSLVIIEEWPDEHTSWSNYLKIKDQSNNDSFPFFIMVQSLHFEKNVDFDTMITFLNIFKEFFKTVS